MGDAGGSKRACKIISKKMIMEELQVEQVLNEQVLLAAVASPYIVAGLGSYRDKDHIYMMLEYVQGCELHDLKKKQEWRRFPATEVPFMVAEIGMALTYLRGLDIVFRDLKPENVLVDMEGHLRVADFGFAK